MHKFYIYIILVFLALMPRVSASGQELRLPVVPDTLCAPHERAAYVVEHFWDNMCFADTALSHNREWMEQNFVNFLSVIPHAPAEAVDSAFANLLRHAGTNEGAIAVVYELAEQYLNEWQSPMYNQDFFISFLSAATTEPSLSALYGDRSRYLLEVAQKNRPGNIATDFAFVQADGSEHTLHQWLKRPTLLVLYSADCDHCRKVIEQLKQHAALAAAVEQGTVNVLAVCIDDDMALWRSQLATMPKQWTVGFDGGKIMDNESYELSDLPAIYLLDADCRVRIKELHDLSALNGEKLQKML